MCEVALFTHPGTKTKFKLCSRKSNILWPGESMQASIHLNALHRSIFLQKKDGPEFQTTPSLKTLYTQFSITVRTCILYANTRWAPLLWLPTWKKTSNHPVFFWGNCGFLSATDEHFLVPTSMITFPPPIHLCSHFTPFLPLQALAILSSAALTPRRTLSAEILLTPKSLVCINC